MPAPYELQLVDGCIVVLRFASANVMNEMLDVISNRVDGPIKNRMGHNFPATEMTAQEVQRVLPKQFHKQGACKYVVACVKGNAQTLKHELCHARFFVNDEYRQTIMNIWDQTLTDKQRKHVAAFLSRLGYKEDVHVDEFQAYALTEAPNFYGTDLSDALDELDKLQKQLQG